MLDTAIHLYPSLIFVGKAGAYPSLQKHYFPMEQRALKNVYYSLNTNISSYFETYCGQSSNLYLNAVHFFNTSVN